MTTKEAIELHNNNNLIGRHGKFIFTGTMVSGVVKDILINDFSVTLFYDMDEPHVWGSETFTSDTAWARTYDEFGSLKHAVLDEI